MNKDDGAKPLFIPLKTEWYEAFESGSKSEELRRHGPRWNANTCRVGRKVTLSCGYGKHRRMSGQVASFTVRPARRLWADHRAAVLDTFGTLDIDIAVIGIGNLCPETNEGASHEQP